MIEELLQIPDVEINKILFKQGDFDFITVRGGKKHKKQHEALCILTDGETEEFGYGGAAGGAKSWTGCVWLAFMCVLFPETRWFIGREELKRLKESTLITFFKVCREYGITGWKYNGQDHFIEFENGSRIDLLDLKYLPSDPLFERYGSTEYTGGWIEEGGEVHFGAYDTLKTRIGRQLNDHYGILGKILVTLNPKKNWCYEVFWKPFKEGVINPAIKFLQSFVTDNPFIETGYVDKLDSIKDKVRKARLRFGDFEYDDDPNALIDYDKILDCFTNDFDELKGVRYITVDVARLGSDKIVIGDWEGWWVKPIAYEKKRITQSYDNVKKLSREKQIPVSRIVCDEDGVGGGLVDMIRCKGFVNNSRPLQNPKTQEDENYYSLKDQCYFKLAERINRSGLYIDCGGNTEMEERIKQELEWVKQYKSDTDGKKRVLPKELIKKEIGGSPDFADRLMMREFFELIPKRSWSVV